MASGALSLAPGTGTSPQNLGLSWEGDKMFNIYIYDYCNKRGFRETAQKLMVEAEIPPDSAPPINAKQGLLFEWWSVFWVLFTAKSSGSGSDDAMLYVQQQSQQQAARQAQARMQPQQSQMTRYMNGQRPPMPPNGQMPNGVGPASLQGAQGPIPNGTHGSMNFPMSGPQPNGIPGTPVGPPVPGSTPQQQQPGFQPMLPSQRAGGPGPQQRGPNNGPSFQSPTMAHSPQNSGILPGQQQPPAMSQLGPSPHMSHMQRGGGMLPPNGQQQPANPPFQQHQRPPSRTASPSNILTQPSPSMANRQPPGGAMNASLEASLNMELSKMPIPLLTSLKHELGLTEKEPQLFTTEEKQRLITLARTRTGHMKSGPPGGNNAAAGPSMQPLQRPQRQSISQQQQRGNKRNSTSPADEHEALPRNDQSPPDRKRPRRSPLSSEQGPPMNAMNYPQQPQQGQQQGGGQGGPQQLPNGMMRPMAPGLNGFPPQAGMQNMGNGMGNNQGMNMQMGGQPMGGPQMSAQGMAQGMAQAQMVRYQHEQQYRQSMQNAHKGGLTGGTLNNAIPGNAGSPSAGDTQGQGPQFAGAVPNNRMNQKGMMLPPSPAGGPSKDQSGQNKDKGGQSTSANRPEGSPRNPPRTPGQGGSTTGNPGQGGTAPPTPNMTAPSPILVNPTSGMNPTGQPMVSPSDPMSIFGGTDFIGSMPTLDAFDDASLKAGFDVDFERDFGQWFNPENDVAGSLDPK